MIPWLPIFIFLFGLSIGSFLNVLIYRLPRNLALGGRSFCPKCEKKIVWYDNIPLLSFILLGGKCRHCHSPISIQYPLVELLTGILFLGTALRVIGGIRGIGGALGWIELIYLLFLVSALIVIFVIDLKHQIIPDSVVYPAILVSLAFLIISYLTSSGDQLLITNNLITAFAAGLFFLLLHLLTRGKGMGLGDVKLAFLMGLVLGFPKVVVAFYFAFLTGALAGVILILAGKRKFGQHIPFGPFLATGMIVTLLAGDQIFQWITALFLQH